jgi:PKD repeat protein
MRKHKWQAKVFYLVLALAFAFGLAPLAATTPVEARVHGDFYAYPMDYAKAGQYVYFYDMSADGAAATSWLWNFGDGSTSTDQNPSHQYYPTNECETYDVTLTATWPSGATDTVTKYDYITVCWGLITEPYSYSYDDYSYYAPSGIDSQIGYNVLKARAIFVVPDGVTAGFAWTNRVIGWVVSGDGHQVAGGTTGVGLTGMPPDPDGTGPARFPWVQVESDGTTVGEVLITAQIDVTGPPPTADIILSATKKWGDINFTELDTMEYDYETGEWVYSDCPGESEVRWYEGLVRIPLPNDDGGYIERSKAQVGVGFIRETVIGTFDDKAGGTFEHPADGAVVHMFLLDGNAPVHNLPQTEQEAFDGDWSATKLLNEVSRLQDLYPPRCVSFFDGDPILVDDNGNLIHVTKVSGDIDLNGNGVFDDPEEMGLTGNTLMADCEEAVKIVFVATYPYEQGPELPVFAEICAWNFWTQQLEKVPEVHWAGEKVVLEKQFGSIYSGYPVLFNLENQSCGSLFPVEQQTNYGATGGDSAMGSQQVLTHVDEYGVARAILESQSPCECDIQCSLYGMPDSSGPYGQLINQAGWVIFFLKFEGITLSNVQGERTGHDSGLWDPIVASGMIWDAMNDDGVGSILVDPTEDWAEDQFVGKTIKVWKGEMEDDGSITYVGDIQVGEVLSNYEVDFDGNGEVVVSTPPWDTVPSGPTQDIQWYYQIVDPVWNPATDDLSQELNVSQDTLLRARVKGWFMGDDLSWRESVVVDLDGDGFAETRLPEGRWVLPDDWPILAGAEWEEFRPHWDIMDQPNDNIMSKADYDADGWKEWGDYIEWTLNESPNKLDKPGDLVAERPVIGPYSQLDQYSPYIQEPWKLNYKTIVPNGKLNWWDCPMPPAKIAFEITDGAGFFKDADKGDIYYQWVETDLESDGPDGIAYTNPYYWEMIPGNPLIPAFVLNGGFDWDSWNPDYGPYPFWKIFNQLPGETPSDPQHPTKVEVYSDNHGEAMVFLNGDWNLDLSQWVGAGGAYDIPTGTVVGDTVVKAIADYPYMRKHLTAVSNTVEKTWTWGKRILGTDPQSWDAFETRMVFQVGDLQANNEKMAFIWVTDRDGNPAVGEKIEWWVAPPGAEISDITTSNGVSVWLPDINVEHGFLEGTLVSPTGEVGGANAALDRGVSFARLPTDEEKALFRKFQTMGDYPATLDVDDYAVAAIYVTSSLPTAFDLTIKLHEGDLGTVVRHTNLNFNAVDAYDDPETFEVGDVDRDGAVNVLDMILVGQNFGKTEVPGDVDKNGDINVLDMTVVGQHFS